MAKRCEDFVSRQPFLKSGDLKKTPSHVNGTFGFLNPTSAHFHHQSDDKLETSTHHDAFFSWSSRDNRKGRHALTLTKSADADKSFQTPAATSTPREIAMGIWRMITVSPVWDVSYLVATIFTLGSVVWVFNAFFVFLPLLKPSTQFNGEILYGGGITAFVGATIFEIGSVLLMLEAINENHEGCFGWALEEVLDGWKNGQEDTEGVSGSTGSHPFRIRRADCLHHHANRKSLVGSGSSQSEPSSPDQKQPDAAKNKKSWQWYPTWISLREHYIYELGFLACFAQLCGATIFWIAGFTALPGIYDHLSPGLVNGVYWTPQIIGGSGFIISGTLFMLETQKKWYMPALDVLGWHIGLWNLIGGVGFTLSPAFGYDTAAWAQYQAACSTFWGSWAFLIGSAVQWYESLDKYPVSISG